MKAYTTISRLADVLAKQGLLASASCVTADEGAVQVSGADCDSRLPSAGHVFICKGAAFSPSYLLAALEKGAVAYVCDEARAHDLQLAAPNVPALVVRDLRRAMAVVSAEAFGHPDRDLTVAGITGTKGKSTVSFMLRPALDGGVALSRAAIIGSICTYDGVENIESHNTTPEAPDLWRHLANARDSGLSYVDMEVSSQALKYDRVLGLDFDVACFLNIGRDHISAVEHPDFEDYFESKLRIFDHARAAVVNLDADRADTILDRAQACERVLTCSTHGRNADVWADGIGIDGGRISFTAHTPTWSGPVQLGMRGLFNVDNALAAIAICEHLRIGRERIVSALADVSVPGRMELVPGVDGQVTALVDYAHNKLSFQSFFSSVSKEFPGYNVIAVFGAPGGKAYERRSDLPQEAAKHADYLIFTEDDPANESVEDICRQMSDATPSGVPHETVLDREEAIRRAVELGYASDRPSILCLLAKGHERRQHEGNEFVPCRTDGEIFLDAVRKKHDAQQDA